MGTPDFAVKSLEALVEAGHDIAAVVTAEDKPSGRGMKLRQSAVKTFAVDKGLKVLQPSKLKSPEFLEELKELNPQLIVVVAFRMLPQVVWDMPEHGTINLHASLLPDYRGAAPINWAIINGENKTGVTTFFINENIDTGAIIDRSEVDISPTDSAGSLHDKLMTTGAALITKTVAAIEQGTAQSIEQQSSSSLSKAPKIFKEDTRIDFSKDGKEVYNFIRGMSPYPAAISNICTGEQSIPAKIFKASLLEDESTEVAGTISSDNKTFLHVQCGKLKISIEELQIAGKKKVGIKEFLNGFQVTGGAKMC